MFLASRNGVGLARESRTGVVGKDGTKGGQTRDEGVEVRETGGPVHEDGVPKVYTPRERVFVRKEGY